MPEAATALLPTVASAPGLRPGGVAPEPRVAIIDIGSNSVRLVVYEGLTRTPSVLFNEKVMAGLGRGLERGGRLPEPAMELTLVTLARFHLLCRAMDVDMIRAVATAAVRDADNGTEFVARLRAETGVAVEVIDGETEARGAAMGVIAGIPDAEGVVGDFGGGSLELVRIADGEAHERVSLPLGSLRLEAIRRKNRRELGPAIERALDAVDWAALGRGQPFYTVGGSWRALAQLQMHLVGWPLPVVHHHVMPADAPAGMMQALDTMTPKALKAVPAISGARVPYLPAAAALMQAVVARLESRCVIASAYGLREGLLFSALPSAARAADPLLCQAREAAIRSGRFADSDDAAAGEALMAFSDPLFAGDPPAWQRIRHAACLLADTAWRAHPDMRAEHGRDTALHGTWVGIDAPGRAMLAAALYVLNGGALDPTAPVPPLGALATQAMLDRAKAWGLALRLGQRIGGGAAGPLAWVALEADPAAGLLRLCLKPGAEALYGEPVQRRHRALAQHLGLMPKVARRR
jgi:exopolyphosphatase/guanosine-5'-triphosphate,3'-diphosphate pyrophosphatase